MKHFLSLRDFSGHEVQSLVDFARNLKANRLGDRLAKRVIGLLFFNPSLRTLASFQAAVGHQGGTSVVIQPGQGTWALETRDGVVMDGFAAEHVREAIPVLCEYCDILGIRSFAPHTDLDDDLADTAMHRFADLSSRPLINMESASDHPCQALADWMTLDELEIPADGKFVLSWAWHPKALPFAVPRAALAMAAQRGMEIAIHAPSEYPLPELLVDEARALGAKSVETFSSRPDALAHAHVLYCKSWSSVEHYAEPDRDLALRASLRDDWCVRESWFETARTDAKFMHCLPVRRNVKVADEVLDGPRSVVIQQAGNRLHAQKSVLIRQLEANP